MEIPCSWPLHIRSSIANELRLTHLTRSRTLLRRPSGGSYAPDRMHVYIIILCALMVPIKFSGISPTFCFKQLTMVGIPLL